jgi:hypothetical protein
MISIYVYRETKKTDSRLSSKKGDQPFRKSLSALSVSPGYVIFGLKTSWAYKSNIIDKLIIL